MRRLRVNRFLPAYMATCWRRVCPFRLILFNRRVYTRADSSISMDNDAMIRRPWFWGQQKACFESE